MEFLSEYNFEIVHIKGKKKNVNALSRKLNQICVISTISWQTNLIEKINSTVDFDQEFMKIKEKFQKYELLM